MSIAHAFAHAPIGKKGAASSEPPSSEQALLQLQTIPTSARMIMTPRREVGSSRRKRVVGGSWKAEMPSDPAAPATARPATRVGTAASRLDDTWGVDTANDVVPDRSALPYLLGGINTLGSVAKERIGGGSTSRTGTRNASRASRGGDAGTTPLGGAPSAAGSVPRLPDVPIPQPPSTAERTTRAASIAPRMNRAQILLRQSRSAPRPDDADDHGPHACLPNCAMCAKIRGEVSTFERLHPELKEEENAANHADDTPNLDHAPAVPQPPKKGLKSRTRMLQRVMDVTGPPALAASGVAPAAGGKDAGAGAAALAAVGRPSSSQSHATALADEDNPLAGLLAGSELHAIYAGYERFLSSLESVARLPPLDRSTQPTAAAAADETALSPPGTVRRAGLSLNDFRALLRSIVPHVSISTPYAERMFDPFAQPSAPPRAMFSAIFAFLCRQNGSSAVERNVRFFLKSMDERGGGWLPAKVLTGPVIRAWAENRVIGKALYAWRAVAAGFDAGPPSVWDSDEQINLDSLRAAVYASAQLFAAFQHQLECVLTDAPRYALKPVAQAGLKLSFRRPSLGSDLPSASPSPDPQRMGSFRHGSFRKPGGLVKTTSGSSFRKR
jgi:hypothetical protein